MSTPFIFINYRRSDSAGHAGRIFDRLSAHFGPAQVFMDTTGDIPAGTPFKSEIAEALAQTTVLLVVLGPTWASTSDDRGPRIMQDGDWVRVEIEAALERGLSIIPVLVNDARLPTERDVPPSLRPFLGINAITIADRVFAEDVQRLIESIAFRVHADVPVRVTDEIYPGRWELKARVSQQGMTIELAYDLELRKDGSVFGHANSTLPNEIANVLGQFGGFGRGNAFADLLGAAQRIEVSGRWSYSSSTRVLDVIAQAKAPPMPMPMMASLSNRTERTRILITINRTDRDVLYGRDDRYIEWIVKRIGTVS